MKWPCNQFGVPQYPDNDIRRLMVLLGAIDLLERPTQSAVADLSGYARDQIDAGVVRLREECGVNLHRVGEIYHIEDWGPLLTPEGVQRLLKPT